MTDKYLVLQEEYDDLKKLMTIGDRISIIKQIRDMTREGLKAARDLVDPLYDANISRCDPIILENFQIATMRERQKVNQERELLRYLEKLDDLQRMIGDMKMDIHEIIYREYET